MMDQVSSCGRSLKEAGTTQACLRCGVFFTGSAAICDGCRKAEGSPVLQADARERVAKLPCPSNTEGEVAKESVFEVSSYSEKVDAVIGAQLVEPKNHELADNGVPSTEKPELAGHVLSSTMTAVPCENQLKHITLQKLNGERVEVTLQHVTPLTISVAAMKSLIQNNPAIPHNSEISLILDDIVLQDERTLADFGVMDGSVLTLVIAHPRRCEALDAAERVAKLVREKPWLAGRRLAICSSNIA